MLRAIKRFFRRRTDLSKTPDRMLDWTDPWERSEGIMRLSNRAAEVLARKMFQDYPPTLGILPRNEELSAMMWAIMPMFIHIAMERMWDVCDCRFA